MRAHRPNVISKVYVKKFTHSNSADFTLKIASNVLYRLLFVFFIFQFNYFCGFSDIPCSLLVIKQWGVHFVSQHHRLIGSAAAMWTLCVPGWGVALTATIILLYGTIDVAYFLRMMFTVACARYFKKKACLLETTEIKSFCLLNDIDTLLYHMNNARYLRELDFARVDFYERTGLYSNIKAAGGSVVQAASTIRYRRFLKPFTRFTITSKAVYWDDKTLFMEHEFVGPGGFVHAVAFCRQRVIDTSAAAIVELLIQLHCSGTCKPPPSKMPPEVELWVQSNELSSAKLRGGSTSLTVINSNPPMDCGEIVPSQTHIPPMGRGTE